MRDLVLWLARQPELLNALAPFALLALCGSTGSAILAFSAFYEWVDAHPAGRRARQLLTVGSVFAALAIALSLFAFGYLYTVNWNAALTPTCAPVRYVPAV